MVALCEQRSRMSIYRGATVAPLSLVIVTVATVGQRGHTYTAGSCCVRMCVRGCACAVWHVS